MDAGLSKYFLISSTSQLQMSIIFLYSDAALYPVLKFLKEKYPQVADKTTITFPTVK
jgi:hypothetical protein